MTSATYVDACGTAIVVGDSVRILVIPQWLTHDLPNEDIATLERRRGTIMKVLEIDAHGFVWFGTDDSGRWFCLRPSEIQVIP